jgi:uncharacterized protein (DUF3084 family)
MEENTQPTDSEAVVTEPSLDDVISEFNVQPAAAPAATQPATVSNEPAQPALAVDPLDTNQFNNYVSQVNNGQSVLNSQLQEVKTELTDLRQERAQLQIEADITEAVGAINEGLNLDPQLVRVHLELMAQQKPGFKAMWENRKENPAAFTKALSALSREVGNTYANKQDPELTANQKAVQQSQKSLAGKTVDTSDNDIDAALTAAGNEGERQRIWSSYLAGQ